MLQAEFPDVRIETSFDAADNIVSWERVADVMTDEMDDSLAHTYASRLRELIAGKGSMDARYRAVRADAALHDYLCKHVLDRVRMVEVSANIIVQKVLSREEIIERYEHDPAFRTRMEPYQYYVMMCHLADNERWNELYEVSRRAYEGYPRERNARVQVATRDTLGRDVLHFVDRAIPYPLAGYYYAVATQKKNKPDLSILRPFLDDGGLEHAAGRSAFMNEEAFVVAQVLMYCRREDFDGANSLIRKYGLMARPELKGLIMFVRCLDGQYLDDPEVREYVMSTSAMNRAVMYAAMQMYREALIILYGDDVPRDDAKVEYLKAICHFNLLDWRLKSYGCDGYSSSAVYDPDGGQDADATAWNTSAWAAPMLNALRLDSDNLKYLENDGYFNDAYRQMIFYSHTRLQAGVPLAKVAAEYDALVARMRKSKAKDR